MMTDPIQWLTDHRKLDAALWEAALHYNPETGDFVWNVRPEDHFPDRRVWQIWNSKYPGKPAGTVNGKSGHLAITLNGNRQLSHRVAWLLSYGEWPKEKIDHINGDPADNRLCNLREVSHRENMLNVKIQTNNSSGVQGVYWHKYKGKWAAKIGLNGRSKTLGYFDQIEDAKQARAAALIAHGYHQNHGRQI